MELSPRRPLLLIRRRSGDNREEFLGGGGPHSRTMPRCTRPPRIQRGTPALPRGLDRRRVAGHPPSFTPRKPACVWPPQARKHACGARKGGGGGAHTCLHVLIPFSFWGLPRFPPCSVTRPTFSPASVTLQAEPTSRRSPTPPLPPFPPPVTLRPVPLPFSPSTLDISRDLNSFYFPYISRSTTPSCCHPPASYVSSNGFSSSCATLRPNRPPTLCSPSPPPPSPSSSAAAAA